MRDATVRRFSGCVGCRKRRKKCDERHPHCSRCISRGIDCVYDDVQMRVFQPKQYEPRPAQTQAGNAPLAADSPACSALVQRANEDQLMAAALGAGQLPAFKGRLRWLPQVADLPSKSLALSRALAALSFHQLSQQPHHDAVQLSKRCQVMYIGALEAVQRDLFNPKLAWNEQTFAAIHLLLMFEMMNGKSVQTAVMHASGLSSYLLKRIEDTPDEPFSEPAQWIIADSASDMMVSNLIMLNVLESPRSLDLFDQVWPHDPKDAHKGTMKFLTGRTEILFLQGILSALLAQAEARRGKDIQFVVSSLQSRILDMYDFSVVWLRPTVASALDLQARTIFCGCRLSIHAISLELVRMLDAADVPSIELDFRVRAFAQRQFCDFYVAELQKHRMRSSAPTGADVLLGYSAKWISFLHNRAVGPLGDSLLPDPKKCTRFSDLRLSVFGGTDGLHIFQEIWAVDQDLDLRSDREHLESLTGS